MRKLTTIEVLGILTIIGLICHEAEVLLLWVGYYIYRTRNE